MLNKGITTFVDFREGGLEGILMLKEVLTKDSYPFNNTWKIRILSKQY